MARRISNGKDDQLSASRSQQVLDGIHAANYQAASKAKRLFDNFVRYAEQLPPVSVPAGTL